MLNQIKKKNSDLSSSPLVTVCIPTIGRLEYIEQTLESLKNQTYQNYEVYILDNACSPDAQAFFKQYTQSDPRIQILRTDQRIPMLPNFNRGISVAQGKYLVFFHDDDVYLPNFIERQVEFLEEFPSVGFVGSNYEIIDKDGEIVRHRRLVRHTEVWSGRRYIEQLIKIGRNIIPMPGIIYRQHVLQKFPFDPELPLPFSDFVFLMKIAEFNDVGLIFEPLMKLRLHGENASEMLISDAITIRSNSMHSYVSEYTKRWPSEYEFSIRLKKYIKIANFKALIWGWLSAPNSSEAKACLYKMHELNIYDNKMLTKILHRMEKLRLLASTSTIKSIRFFTDRFGL